MDKSPDAFRTISEVAEWLGVQAHVLRFWESKFTQVKPVKRAGGRRYYRPSDMELLGGIKKLLHDDGLTVKGVQKILSSEGIAHVSSLSPELCDMAKEAAIRMVGESPSEPEIPSTVLAFTGSAPQSESGKVETAETNTKAPAIIEGSAVQTPDTPVAEPDSEKAPEAPVVNMASDDTEIVPVKGPVTGPAAGPVIGSNSVTETESENGPEPIEIQAAEPDTQDLAGIKQEPDQQAEPAPESIPAPSFASNRKAASPPPEAPNAEPENAPVEEKPILPSFLHREAPETPRPEVAAVIETVTDPTPDPISESIPESARDDSVPDTDPAQSPEPAQEVEMASAPESEPESKPEPVVEAKKSLVIDAPDPPVEADIPYSKGPLAYLSRVNALTVAEVENIAPLAKELQAWLSRSGGPDAR